MTETTQDIPYGALIEARVTPDPRIMSQLEAQLRDNPEINFEGHTYIISRKGRSIEIYRGDGCSVVITRSILGPISARYFSPEGREDI